MPVTQFLTAVFMTFVYQRHKWSSHHQARHALQGTSPIFHLNDVKRVYKKSPIFHCAIQIEKN